MSDADQSSEPQFDHDHSHDAEGPGYITPQAAIEESTPEEIAYVMGLYEGTDVDAPDFMAVVDVDPESDTYAEIIDRVEMPNRGDELHHFGWNACSSSCHIGGLERRHLIVPGQRSSRIHVIDTQHCIPDGEILISMLGDADGSTPGGFLELNEDFEIEGRWDTPGDIEFNYDFWYQPRHNVMVSTEWAAPETYYPGFDLEDVEAGKYGRKLHFWNWEEREVKQTVDLGEDGLIPLEVRFF
ncbi:MAG: selenium-binding protein SBP56-related protein, partial [Halobacteriaceae archaeon]